MRSILAAAIVSLAAATGAQAKVYSGSEAAALRCAAILSVVPSAAARAGVISQSDVRIFHVASGLILARYVSGNGTQKSKALQTVMQRYSAVQHISDFRNKSKTCLSQFPIS